MQYSGYGFGSVPASSYAMQAYQSGKITVPVSRNSYIYSHFRHVAGTIAPEGTQGVSVTRLKVLDNMIDQLVKLRKKPEILPSSATQLSDRDIDLLIEQYAKQIQIAEQANKVMPYAPRPSVQTGNLVNLVA